MISRHITRTFAVFVALFILISCTAAGFYFGLNYVLSQNDRFEKLEQQISDSTDGEAVHAGTPGAVELIIPRAADTQQIADILVKKRIIKNPFMFSLLSKFNGFDGAYQAGTHFVTRTMSYDEIMYILTTKPNAVRVTIPEGLTYKEIKEKLRAAGLNFDETAMDNMVRNPRLFLDYDFVTEIEKNDGRILLLQGYLFPDTYEFDVNVDEETILRTFLDNMASKLTDDNYLKASRNGMTMDQVITLASIIQNECSDIEEMRTVSSVFHNRLNTTGWTLSSCATVNYLLKEDGEESKLWLSNTDINRYQLNRYNTYLFEGLPPGPICSPGTYAIMAALYPLESDYMFFSAKGDGTNVFAATQEQHEANIALYQSLYETGQTLPSETEDVTDEG